MGALLQDLRFGLRMLRKNHGFTTVAVLALALGIGANSAMFSVINAVLLRPLPFPESDKIVQMVSLMSRKTGEENTVGQPDFRDFEKDNRTLDSLAAYQWSRLALTVDRAPVSVLSLAATSGLFKVLRVTPMLGRTLLPREDALGAPPVAILSHQSWRKRFASNPQVVGTQIRLDGRSFTVVGVMGPGFSFPVGEEVELWIPLGADRFAARAYDKRGSHSMEAIARLRSGVSIAQAHEDLDTICRRLEKLYPSTNPDSGIKLVPLQERLIGKHRATLLVLLAAVALVLLIACANVANLLLARSTARQREVAIRVALGASRGRLARQLLTESVLLGCVGGALGALLSLWAVDLLAATVLSEIPGIAQVRVDGTALAVTAGISIFTGLIFGLAPAIAGSRSALSQALKEGAGRLSGGARRRRVQDLLIVVQVALALVLLAGAGLMIKSVVRLGNVDPGFDVDRLLTTKIRLSDQSYSMSKTFSILDRLLRRVGPLPGVEAVGLSSPLPFSGGTDRTSFKIEGAPPLAPDEHQNTHMYCVSEDYFQAMGVPLRSGRGFSAAEMQGVGEKVVIINESFARRFWPNRSPLGKRIDFGTGLHRIVGVVGNVKHRELDTPSPLQMYMPYTEAQWIFASLVVRTAIKPASLTGAVRSAFREVDPELPVIDPKPMRENLAESFAGRRSLMILLAAFAGLALLLSGIGIYGVIAYTVGQRTHEIGIRAALGCPRAAILGWVIGKGARLVALGLALGLAGAFVATRLLGSLLYGVSATDPSTFALMSLALAAIALLASYIPARRATRVDPLIALRAE